MMTLIIIIHVLACIVLIGLVLIQRGRGGGLVESFSSVESMFGTKTNAFLTRTTTIMSIVFFLTCLSLAVLSVRQSKSLLRNAGAAQLPVSPSAQAAPAKEAAGVNEPPKEASQAAVTKIEEKAPPEPQQATQKEQPKQEEPKTEIPKTEKK